MYKRILSAILMVAAVILMYLSNKTEDTYVSMCFFFVSFTSFIDSIVLMSIIYDEIRDTSIILNALENKESELKVLNSKGDNDEGRQV